jgi:serine/threonine protein kinase
MGQEEIGGKIIDLSISC